MRTKGGYEAHEVRIRCRVVLTLCLLGGIAVGSSGCSSGSSAGPGGVTSTASVVAPAITAQPADQSVPMGLSASYSVTATGSSLKYQWAKNGAAIAGATGDTYATPTTAFTDTGARFSVTVSNSAGMVGSNPALLTVTARAPAAGDLRFQQVDAASTVNGWGNAGVGISTALPGRSAMYFSPSLGTPLYVGSGGTCDTPPTMDGVGCSWFFSETPLAASANTAAVLAGYGADFYDSFQADLQSSTTPLLSFGNGITAVSSASVITSLDLEPASNLFALSWVQSAATSSTSSSTMSQVQSTGQTGFVREQNTVAPADLQAAAAAEGAAGRVITAISNDGGAVTYFAYAWQADTTTLYEAKIATASTDDAPAAAASLAAQGYIITATGQADSTGNIYLVGTRVQGDTLARPFVAAQGSTAIQSMQQQGYAEVGVILNIKTAEEYTYLGER
jgi:hypothetical protein